jgi:hypothetical protein
MTSLGALQTLDIVACAAVEDGPRNDPPAQPAIGAAYLVGSSPTGAWSGQADCLAGWTSGGWRFVTPTAGLTALVKSSGLTACCNGSAWELGLVRGAAFLVADQQVVGARAAAIAAPTGGATVDSQARLAVSGILAALRSHGLIDAS